MRPQMRSFPFSNYFISHHSNRSTFCTINRTWNKTHSCHTYPKWKIEGKTLFTFSCAVEPVEIYWKRTNIEMHEEEEKKNTHRIRIILVNQTTQTEMFHSLGPRSMLIGKTTHQRILVHCCSNEWFLLFCVPLLLVSTTEFFFYIVRFYFMSSWQTSETLWIKDEANTCRKFHWKRVFGNEKKPQTFQIQIKENKNKLARIEGKKRCGKCEAWKLTTQGNQKKNKSRNISM